MIPLLMTFVANISNGLLTLPQTTRHDGNSTCARLYGTSINF